MERKTNQLSKIYEKAAISREIYKTYIKMEKIIWAALLHIFLRYIKWKKFERILKMDLWDETVLKNDIIKEIQKLKVKKIYFIEIVKSFFKKFKTLYPSHNKFFLINGNIEKMPFKENSFDLIIDVSTCDQIRNLKKLLNSYKKILKNRGYLILFHINSNYFNIKNFTKNYDFPFYLRKEIFIDRNLKKNNFRIIKKKYFFTILYDPDFSITTCIIIRVMYTLSLIFGHFIYIFYLLIFSNFPLFNWIIGYLCKLEK